MRQAREHEYLWGDEGPPAELWTYMNHERRHAVAHAVRNRDRPELDPNDPALRGRFYRDSRVLRVLVKDRVRERWGPYVVWERRRPGEHS